MGRLLEVTLAKISAPQGRLKEAAAAELELRSGKTGRLGRLGEMTARYAAIIGAKTPAAPKNCMVIACADHGVARHGISAYPVETTLHMTANYLISKGASANAFANFCGADMVVVDVGVAGDLSHVPGLLQRKIGYGTADFTQGAAMTHEQAVRSLEIGIEIVNEKVRQGYTCFSLGEMGIGNTSSSAAIVAAFLGLDAEYVTGRGTGISDQRLKIKLGLVKKALEANRPDAKNGIDVLAKVGGFELGALAGVVLGCAANSCAVVLDGSNTTASALIAHALAPLSREYMFASHLSAEPAHTRSLRHLGLEACVRMGVGLGEAIGASVVMDMLKLGCSLLAGEEIKLEAAQLPRKTQNECAFKEWNQLIRPLDETAMNLCQQRLDNLTKPLGSLHSFEHLIRQMAGVTRNPRPRSFKKALLLDADESGAAEKFAAHIDAKLFRAKSLDIDQFDLKACLQAGFAEGAALGAAGFTLLASGMEAQTETEELINLLAEKDCEILTALAVTKNEKLVRFSGFIVGAAAEGAAVVLDGAPALASALAAVRIAPACRPYLIGSQFAMTQAEEKAMSLLEMTPYLDLKLDPGRGCAGALTLALLEASLHMLNDMKTFGDAQVAVAEDGPGALRQNAAVRDER